MTCFTRFFMGDFDLCAGEAVAVTGLCPHRLYPLVKGRLQGDAIQCGYHGFTYDKTGRSIHIPSQDEVPPKFGVRRYPSIEKGGVVWVWTGDEVPADASRLPNPHSVGLGVPGWTVEQHPPKTIKARYQLLIDNLLDLSHISFIHATSIPGGGSVVHIPFGIIDSPTSLNVRRVGRGLPNNPHLKFLFPEYDDPVDQDFDAEYLGPNLIRTGGSILASPAGDAQPRQLGVTNFLHGITSETPNSVHYYVMTARNCRAEDPALGAANIHMGLLDSTGGCRSHRVNRATVDRFADTLRELSCAAVVGSIAVRRRLTAQIRAELQKRAVADTPSEQARN